MSEALWRQLEFAGVQGDGDVPAELWRWLAYGGFDLSHEDLASVAALRRLELFNFVFEVGSVDRLYASMPLLETLVLDEAWFAEDTFVQLSDLPEAHPLRHLAIGRPPEPVDSNRFATARLAQRVTSLACDDAPDAGVSSVLCLPALETLSLHAELGSQVAATLGAGNPAAGLRGLSLTATLVESARPAVLRALAAWSLPALEVLDLSLKLDTGWVDLLADASMLANLVELRLGNAKIGSEGLEALSTRTFHRLRSLSLWGVTDRGVRALLRAPWIASLSELWVINNSASSSAWAELRASMPALDLRGVG